MDKYLINGQEISFSVHIFDGKKSYENYENSIFNALKKIGVNKKYIEIKSVDEKGVLVNWKINGSNFSFFCNSQPTLVQNIGAVAQAIQEDVRQIQRGIKDLNLVMKQYEELESSKLDSKKKGLDNYANKYEENYEFKDTEEFPINFSSDYQARETINSIKKKYSNFTDLSLLPDNDKKSLREAYLYLGIIVKF